MEALAVLKIECASELEEALTYYLQESYALAGLESRRRSDFEVASQRHDSTFVDLTKIENLPEDLELTAYLPVDVDQAQVCTQVQAKIRELAGYGLATGKVRVYFEAQTLTNWETTWQENYPVINFSRHLAFVPVWQTYQPAYPDQAVIKLNSGLGFGTGEHLTTQLALLAMERYLTHPVKLADVGTGSGILAIAAAKMGQTDILATDISSQAIEAARENATLNQLTTIRFQQGNLLEGVSEKFDVICANILAEILQEFSENLASYLTENGVAILSGIETRAYPALDEKLQKLGFKVKLHLNEERWHCLVVGR
ncbi:50S ribosomal protein L11 methyltransferase [Ligilactobacillus equi]|uniref:50S ribosomal protein L11 methyltransferase n=1 Tax=Ligilactobacillus equi TaxID=137357 RepID=UPI002ED2EB67